MKGRIEMWLADLPTELVLEIFKYLPQSDLASVCRVSRYCTALV